MSQYKNQSKKPIKKSFFNEEHTMKIRKLHEKSIEQSATMVNPFTKQKMKTYMLLLIPVVGLYFVLRKESPFNNSEKTIQAIFCIIYIVAIIQAFGLLG